MSKDKKVTLSGKWSYFGKFGRIFLNGRCSVKTMCFFEIFGEIVSRGMGIDLKLVWLTLSQLKRYLLVLLNLVVLWSYFSLCCVARRA